jgi:hypothetical protein
MKALLLAYFTAPLLSPESMLVRRMLHATASPGLSWDLVTVNPSFAYGVKDHGSGIALEALEHPPTYAGFPPQSMPWLPFTPSFPGCDSFRIPGGGGCPLRCGLLPGESARSPGMYW